MGARPAIDLRLVRQLAELVHLEIDEREAEQTLIELEQILDYVTKLGELDTTDVPATAQPMVLGGAWRDDAPQPSLPVEVSLRAAPERLGDTFGVPRPID